jgi:hypothetical protein
VSFFLRKVYRIVFSKFANAQRGESSREVVDPGEETIEAEEGQGASVSARPKLYSLHNQSVLSLKTHKILKIPSQLATTEFDHLRKEYTTTSQPLVSKSHIISSHPPYLGAPITKSRLRSSRCLTPNSPFPTPPSSSQMTVSTSLYESHLLEA